MSYVGGPFKHDIFVSYSHGEPDSQGESKLEVWSQQFAAELETELKAHDALRDKLSIYIDKRLDRLSGLTDQLQQEVSASAMLAVLLTPSYLRSSWCAKERDWWLAAQKSAPVQLAHDGRVALVRALPVKGGESAWPEVLADSHGVPLPGFHFYKDAPGKLSEPFANLPADLEGASPFRAALGTLVGALRLRLNELKTRVDERERIAAEAARLIGMGQTVYLHGRSDHAKVWEQAHESLSESGFVVVPGEPESLVRAPAELQELRKERVKVMSGCDALLLVGSENGLAMDADMIVVGRQDRESAKAISNRLLPCALLDTIGPAVATRQRLNMARNLKVDWIDSTREWTSGLQAWLGQKGDGLRGAS
jgi:hypothetical protein